MSPSRVARVITPARSEPPRGSLRNCTSTSSPRMAAEMRSRFCCSLPMSRIVGAQIEKVGMLSSRGISYPSDSSLKARWWAGVRPRPPYSLGKQIPAKPPAYSIFCSSRARSHSTSSSSPMRRGGLSSSFGMFSLSQARARRRNDSTSSISSSWSVMSASLSDLKDVGDPAAVLLRRAVQRAVHRDPAQVEVEVVLPGDPDAAVELHAVLDDLDGARSEEHTSELQSRENLVCRLLLEKKKDRE